MRHKNHDYQCACNDSERLRRIEYILFKLGGTIMSELSDLKASMSSLSDDVNTFITGIEAEVAALQKQIADLQAAGGGATAQDLIDLKAQADAIDAAVKAAPVVPVP